MISTRFVCFATIFLVALPLSATTIVSTFDSATLGGLSFEQDDLAAYDPATDTATLLFDGAAFSDPDENIDAVSILPGGNIVLSTNNSATLGGLSFTQDDLVEYNPNTGTASLLFEGAANFSTNENINAASVLANGNLVLSTVTDATLGGVSFTPDDLVEFNPSTGVATLLFDGAANFTEDENIDAAAVLPNGNIVFSAGATATIDGITFTGDDLIEYDPVSGSATLIFVGSPLFGANENILAVSFLRVPEPSASLLAAAAMAVAGAARGRRAA